MFPKILICNNALYSTSILKTYISRFIEVAFYEVSYADELLAKLRSDAANENHWDYIFIDLELKDKPPMLLLPEIIRLSPDSTIVLTGGISLSDENIAIALNLGITHFLPKPFNQDYIGHIFSSK